MIVEHLVEQIRGKSDFVKLMVGSAITALAISLGMTWISRAFDFTVGSVIPAALGAIGAAVFAARMRKP